MAAEPAAGRGRTVIESLGVYLPPRRVSTAEVLRGCRCPVRFPLERMTGIESRPVAGDGEFSLDLAKQAIARCLAASRHRPDDVDLLISASISRLDGPGFAISYEPSTALRLKAHFGFGRAWAFDLRSACSGMFAAMEIVDALIQEGAIDRGLVVSGEYITHVTATAQKEVEELLDRRLACLTLGDSGAAVLLEASSVAGAGFAALDLCTLGGYARCCVAGPTEREHGGAIMFTDALELTAAAARHGSEHAMRTLERAGWPSDAFDHLIVHQTSRTALNGAVSAINRRLGRRACHPGNTLDNLARRGNTATTTHLVALADGIESGRIRSGDRLVFAISGSGLTLGTALYTLDDLPHRLTAGGPREPTDARAAGPAPPPRMAAAGIRITGVGLAPCAAAAGGGDSTAMLENAAVDCLERCRRRRDEIDLLIYAGTYRSRFVAEPAIAALLAGALGIHPTSAPSEGRGVLAFDVFNGGVGVLDACRVAAGMIRAGRAAAAMVVAAETENNAADFPDDLVGIAETGSALLLEPATGRERFGPSLFRAFPEHADAFVSHWTHRGGKAYLRFTRAADLERRYLAAIVETAGELLRRERIEPARIARVFPPQISSAFISALSRAMDLPRDRFVDAVGDGRDLFTSSLPFALRHACDHHLIRPGDLGLIVTAGSGIQVGCALYHF
jgi:3-oxoacyl-[acyl-carrier-protein] synthase III